MYNSVLFGIVQHRDALSIRLSEKRSIIFLDCPNSCSFTGEIKKTTTFFGHFIRVEIRSN